MVMSLRNKGLGKVGSRNGKRNTRKGWLRPWVSVDDSPIDSFVEVKSKAFETFIMDLGWSGCKLRKSGDGIANAGASGDVGIE
jgi:hypothetical protein